MLFAPVILDAYGWRGMWWLVLLLLLVSTAAAYGCKAHYRLPRSQSASRKSLANARKALRQPGAWLFAAVFSLYSLQFSTVVIWLPTFLKEQRAYSTLALSLLSALVIIFNMPGNLLGGVLVQRNFSRGALISITCLMMGVSGVGIFSTALPDWLRYSLCLVFSFVGGVVPATVMSSTAVLAHSPQQIGTVQGLFMQGANLGQFAGPPLVASVVAATGRWQDAVVVTVSAAAAALVIGEIARRHEADN